MRKLLAAVFLCSALLHAQAPAKRPMTFADLMAMKRVSDPQVSPSGKWVLFSVTDVSLEKNAKVNHLWVVPLDRGPRAEGHGPSERQVTSGMGEANGRFSPDGKWVMFSHKGQVWVAPFDDLKGVMGDDHAVTSLETGADGAIWAPDSRHILFTSSVWPECESTLPMGAEHDRAEAKCNADKDAAQANDPVKARVFDGLLYRHWNQYMGPQHSHIFYGSVDPKDAPPTDITPASVVGDHEAPTFSLGGPLGYAISPDGKEIAYEVNLDKVPAESTNNDIFTLAVGAEPKTAKKVSTAAGSDDGPQYSPDGKWLAWRSQARNGYESDKVDLVVMDRATGTIKNLTTKFDGWVDEFAWNVDSDSLYFASNYLGQEPIYAIRTGDTHVKKLEDPNMLGEFGSLQLSPDGKKLVASYMTVDRPAEVAVITTQEKEGWTNDPVSNKALLKLNHVDLVSEWFPVQATVISHTNNALLAQLDMGWMERYFFPGANGVHVEGFVVVPPNFDKTKKYPVKFLIHGGPQGAWGDAWSYRWNPELMAASGYVVVMVNPRGSTGYGQKFLEQVSGDWGGRAYEDLMKGMDYAEQQYTFIDKNRECALGASYGGFMADWILTHTDRFKCIVTHDGMSDPASAFGDTEELWFNEWEFRPLAGASGGSREQEVGSRKSDSDAVVEQGKPSHPWDFYGKPESENPYVKWSPMRFIKNAHTPTLVVHGQLDYRLDVSQGFELFTALQLLGVPSKMLYFPDEGHWVLKPKNAELWNATVSDWCDRWTGSGKYAGEGQGPRAVGQVDANKVGR